MGIYETVRTCATHAQPLGSGLQWRERVLELHVQDGGGSDGATVVCTTATAAARDEVLSSLVPGAVQTPCTEKPKVGGCRGRICVSKVF